jgi:hypothetical protein
MKNRNTLWVPMLVASALAFTGYARAQAPSPVPAPVSTEQVQKDKETLKEDVKGLKEQKQKVREDRRKLRQDRRARRHLLKEHGAAPKPESSPNAPASN